MKKLFSLFLSCVLVLSISPSGMALDNLATIDSTRVSSITNNAVAFLVAANCGNTPEEPIPMYNLKEEIEVLYFPLLPDGYLIASYKDGHIIEFSSSGSVISVENISEKFYYNGIMEYYKRVDDTKLLQLLTNDIIAQDYLVAASGSPFLANMPSRNYNAPIVAYGVDPNNPTPINSLSTSSTYACVITAVTNLLQYYHDFKGADVYAENISSARSLRQYLKNDNYVKSQGPEQFDWVAIKHAYDGVHYLGLNAYFNRTDVDTYTINTPKLSANDIKTQLRYSRPVLLDIYTNVISPGRTDRHAVMAYTYWETANTTYLICDNTWGNTGVHICTDDLDATTRVLYLS